MCITSQGPGLSGAHVIVDNKLLATTGEDGIYHLDSMKSGTYRLQVEAPRMSFDVTTVKVTPNTPQLPDMVAARYVLFCCKICAPKRESLQLTFKLLCIFCTEIRKFKLHSRETEYTVFGSPAGEPAFATCCQYYYFIYYLLLFSQ
jgi:hypothetical protein